MKQHILSHTHIIIPSFPTPHTLPLYSVQSLTHNSTQLFHFLKTQTLNSSNLSFVSLFCSFTPSPPIHSIVLVSLSLPSLMMCLIDMNVKLCSTHISLFITIILISTHTQTLFILQSLTSHPQLPSHSIFNQHNTHSPSTICSINTHKSFIPHPCTVFLFLSVFVNHITPSIFTTN